jgi:hypothetical protein
MELSPLKGELFMFAVDVLAGRPRDERKSYAKRIESHPETGTYPQKYGTKEGVLDVVNEWAIGLASGRV